MYLERVVAVGEEASIREYRALPSRLEVTSDRTEIGLNVTELRVANVSWMQGSTPAEDVNGYELPGDRMLEVRVRNDGPLPRKVRLALAD